MKKILFLSLVALFATTTVMAQKTKGKKEGEKAKTAETAKGEQAEEEENPHWKTAERGLELFENRKWEEAKDTLTEALKYVDEFPDEDKARVHYSYAKCIQKTHKGDADFLYMVKVYKAYHEAAKYGSGWYQKECEIEMGDHKEGMNRRFIDGLDQAEAGALSEEEMDLMIWAAELLGWEEEKQQLILWKAWMKDK